ncbi:ABC transporter substrate-binding protein [Paenibacillus sp. N3.4]|nr:ABC transporter substrate-binding protein [Paenibacillus sp. N3.4]
MKTWEDHLQRKVSFRFPPNRIISLCPSITETLYALQLSDRIVGRTRYCIHPANQIQQATIVGGTKQVKVDVIAQLKPDLIIAEKEENPKEMVENLAKQFPVYVTNVEQYDDALHMIRDLGVICNREEPAESMVKEISKEFQSFQPINQGRVAYVIWKNPYMVAGHRTYIDSMLEKFGFTNVFKDRPERYPSVTIEEFQRAQPDFIFLSSEPYPFKDIHKNVFVENVPGARTILVDGEIFSWYGTHMLKAADYANLLIKGLKQ